MLGGVKMGSGMMGKLGRAWVGAWVVHGMVHWWCVVCWWMCWIDVCSTGIGQLFGHLCSVYLAHIFFNLFYNFFEHNLHPPLGPILEE